MLVLTNQRPSDRCHCSCVRFFPSVPAGSVHRRGHSIQMIWLGAIKHGLANGRGGMHHAAVESQRRRPGFVTSVIIAWSNHSLVDDRRQVLTHRVVHKRHTVTSVGVIWQCSTQNKKDANRGFIAPRVIEALELVSTCRKQPVGPSTVHHIFTDKRFQPLNGRQRSCKAFDLLNRHITHA